MCGIACTNAGADMTLRLIAAIEKTGGEFTLKDAAKIRADIEREYKVELYPTKVSTKPAYPSVPPPKVQACPVTVVTEPKD